MDGVRYHTERLDHLGIAAGICHEIDLYELLLIHKLSRPPVHFCTGG